MPSPFPGMDPFLEHPDHFPNLHNRLIVYLEDALQQVLPEPYFAKSGRRVWIESGARNVEPDVNVHEHSHPRTGRQTGGRSVASLEETHPIVVTLPLEPDDPFRESYLEVYSRDSAGKQLVTSIEVLSRANKSGGSKGRKLFQKKQRQMMEEGVNLVEIDLLRWGKHTTAVPQPLLAARCPQFDYHICIHQTDQPREFFLYPFLLQDSIPDIAIPLRVGAKLPLIELQAIFNRCYDAGSFPYEIDYSHDPIDPPLSPAQRAYATELLKGRLANGAG